MNYEILDCTKDQLEIVKKYIHQFELDDRELEHHQFLIAIQNNTIIGFGRIREHNGCSELCSLGVIESKRNKSVGISISEALVKKAKQPLYLVCIIPAFFEKIGFMICDQYPNELRSKLNYCTQELTVPETYVVMKNNNF